MDHVNGADFSDYQDPVDFAAFKQSGYSFAYAKATEGTDFTAATFAQKRRDAKEAGVLFGAYHFFKFDRDPVAQAEHFLNAYEPENGDLPPMLDLEDEQPLAPAARISMISKFLLNIEPHLDGAKMVLYMGAYYWSDCLNSTDGFAGHPLWLAQYVSHSTIDRPYLMPHAWEKWTFWQRSDAQQVGGVSGGVDWDWFNGDLDALQGMCLTGV